MKNKRYEELQKNIQSADKSPFHLKKLLGIFGFYVFPLALFWSGTVGAFFSHVYLIVLTLLMLSYWLFVIFAKESFKKQIQEIIITPNKWRLVYYGACQVAFITGLLFLDQRFWAVVWTFVFFINYSTLPKISNKNRQEFEAETLTRMQKIHGIHS